MAARNRGRPTATDEARESRRDGIQLVLVLAVLMWVVEVVDQIGIANPDSLGIEPRQLDGLTGVVAAPFLHGSFDHLISNTVPFLLFGFAIALSGALRVLGVTVIVALVGGLGTWLVGPAGTLHIGASGIVFGYGAYLISRGLFSRSILELGMGLVVGAVWGGALLGGLLPEPGISWQGHLFGAIGGVVAAVYLNPRRRRR